ncbi:MAG: PorT family protein [Prevotellaceae bacterium]|jgi:hypothetical protein|nr:PorT family protein [Prevotellaceae bacterium]
MKQKIILLLLVLCAGLPSVAQHRHEISIAGGYGLSSLQYESNFSNHKKGYNAQAGLGYNFYFTPNWSVKTGAGLGFYSANVSLDGTVSYPKNRVGDIDFAYAYTGYKETVSTALLTVPVMVQGETGGRVAFYAALGAKIGIPLLAQYKTSGHLTTSGYHVIYKLLFDNLPHYGFGQYDVDEITGWDLNLSVQLSLEAGAKWRLTDRFSLYVGGYFDYGLMNLNKKPDDVVGTRLITYQPATKPDEYKFFYGGLFNNSKKLYPVAAGITLRLSFGLSSL